MVVTKEHTRTDKPGDHKFSRNPGTTSKFEAPEVT